MYSQNDIINYLKNNKESFSKKYGIIKLGVFGSFARDTQNEKSDLDILVEFIENPQNLYDTKEAIKKEIKKDLHLKVDVCREKALNIHFKNLIFSEVIYV